MPRPARARNALRRAGSGGPDRDLRPQGAGHDLGACGSPPPTRRPRRPRRPGLAPGPTVHSSPEEGQRTASISPSGQGAGPPFGSAARGGTRRSPGKGEPASSLPVPPQTLPSGTYTLGCPPHGPSALSEPRAPVRSGPSLGVHRRSPSRGRPPSRPPLGLEPLGQAAPHRRARGRGATDGRRRLHEDSVRTAAKPRNDGALPRYSFGGEGDLSPLRPPPTETGEETSLLPGVPAGQGSPRTATTSKSTRAVLLDNSRAQHGPEQDPLAQDS